MKKNVGLWIDHERAVIVSVVGNEETVKQIDSALEKAHRQSGVSTPADDVRLHQRTNTLNRYYDAVVLDISGAASIHIFGPGEAKGELNKRLQENNYTGTIVGVEPADKMTDAQIAAKVREQFIGRSGASASKGAGS